MHWVDWLIVVLLNGTVIGVGFYLARGTATSGQWFLAGRALPWWAVGISMFATNVDNADLVGVTGNTYSEGFHIITVYAIASAAGGILAAFWIVPAMCRAGFFTNAEYLESRYGTSTRVLSALIQIQYRSSMLGLMTWSAYLLLTELVKVPPASAWMMIVAMVVLAGIYTAWGGLKSVVWTDSLQGIVMMIGAAVIIFAVWSAVGGWSNIAAKLEQSAQQERIKVIEARHRSTTAETSAAAAKHESYAKLLENRTPAGDLPHIGRYRGDDRSTSTYFVVLGWIIIGSGYWTVNHTQTMRLMGTRSLWDMKMAALFGVTLSLPVMVACAALGVFGRAIVPGLEKPDALYPMLANDYLGVGLKGLVVAGVFAAVISTFDSMGSALSAVFTRDIYARLFVPDRDDRHYVLVSRWATVGILCLGFLYLPFIAMKENMIKAFTTLIPVFVTPLFTIYVLGVLTRVHRRSGLIGLLCGSAYGLIALYDREATRIAWLPEIEWLPSWFTGRWVALSWSFLFTSLAMIATTCVFGAEPAGAESKFKEAGWLEQSRGELPPLREHPFRKSVPLWLNPIWYAVALMAFSCYVVFGLFW